MALFDNVTYTYYSDTLGRAEVPDETTFDNLKLEVTLYVKSLYNDGLIEEREDGGIDNATCMMIEEVYKAQQTQAGADNVDTSESIGGYSHSMSAKAAELAIEKNAKSLEDRCYMWLRLYCYVWNGVR